MTDRTPVAPPDLDAAAAMWRGYADAHPQSAAAGGDHTVEGFGDSEQLADQLLALVLTGQKRATAELVSSFLAEGDLPPRVGSHWIACDGRGVPRVVLRSTELRVGPLESVDDAFAFDEGEDDRMRDTWLREHRRYFTRTCAARGDAFSEDDDVVFERFSVVWPPELAD
ncbi:hypothetical protein GCM10027282_26050 [Frigoribacterium salinisoli]